MRENLFSVPLFAVDVPDVDGHRQRLIEHIATLAGDQPSVRRSNRNKAWHSGAALMGKPQPAVVDTLRAVMTAARGELASFHNHYKVHELALTSFWAMIMPAGGYCSPHHHVPSPWAGVYYLQVPSQPDQQEPLAGQLEFLNPMPALATIGVGNHAIEPKAGQLLLFPASLVHHVHPHEGPEDRIALAMNFGLKPV